MKGSFWQQFGALMKKNFLVKMRMWKTTLAELLLPVVVMALMVAIRGAVSKQHKDIDLHMSARQDFNLTSNIERVVEGLDRANFRWALVPDNDLTSDLQDYLEQQQPALIGKFKRFKSNGALNNYCSSESYGKKASRPGIWGAIVIRRDGTDDFKWEYTMRMNVTADDGEFPPSGAPNTYDNKATNDFRIGYSNDWHYIYDYGWYSMQYLTENFFLERSTGTPNLLVNNTALVIQPFPTPKHVRDDFADYVAAFLGLFFTLVYIWPVSRIIKLLVEEKELRIKEAMKMMGLTDGVLWLSWAVTYIIMFLITAALIVAVTTGTVYDLSNRGWIFLYFFLFGCSVFAFCFMISSFFSRARVASTMGALIFLAIFFPYFAVAGKNVSEGQKNLACLSAPVCFGLGASTAQSLESDQVGVTNDSLNRDTYNFKFGTAIGMLIVDTILYTIIGLYLDRTVKQQYGVSLPHCFCLRPSWWCKSRRAQGSVVNSQAVDEHIANNKNIEVVGRDMPVQPAISVMRLTKDFTTPSGAIVQAVKDFSANMYEGQIFALLGHNGAGKTTVISMLSGLYSPSSGDASIYGKELLDQLAEIRQDLGVCPQHNILFDLLTVREHLAMFAAIKGVESSKIPEEVEAIIKQVGLTEKRDTLSMVLSGGQKRKLSVGIALIGGSRVVFLDEPTSGMDPYSRRNTWQMLRDAKQGRVIILTTHFMDEADQLGDRIAIMANGEIKCLGSSLFLKARYGVGYSFTVTKVEKASKNDVIHFVKSRIPTAEVITAAGSEITFRVPFDSASAFPSLFRDIDGHQSEYGIDNYSMSVTTLEEVFLRVAHSDATVDEREKDAESKRALQAKSAADGDGVEEKANGGTDRDRESFPRDTSHNSVSKPAYSQRPPRPDVSFSRHFQALLAKRWHNAKRDKKVLTWQIIYPFLILLLGCGLVKLGEEFEFPGVSLTTSSFNTPNIVPVNAFDASYPTNVLPSDSDDATDKRPDVRYDASAHATINDDQAMNQYLLDSFTGDLPRFKTSRYGAYNFRQVNATFSDFTMFINTSGSAFALPIYTSLYNAMRLRETNPNAKIDLHFSPLPRTSDQKTLNSSLTAVIISIAFAFIPASFVGWVVYEREVSAKHQQFISGVSVPAYWLSTYLWDCVSYLVPGLLCIIVVGIYDIKQLLGEGFGPFILGIILSGLAVTAFTYMVSFLFKNHVSAQNFMLMVYFFTGAVLLIVSVVLYIIDSTRSTNRVLVFFYRLFPSYCFGELLSSVIIRDAVVVWGKRMSPWDMDISGWNLVYLTIEPFVYLGVVFLIEYVQRTPELMEKFVATQNVADEPYEEDPDVEAEAKRVNDGAADKEMIVIKGLRKVFPSRVGEPPKVAVKNLTFGIPERQCFGFLGINGAGKTTALRMLTADEVPTSGNAFLHGYSILTHQNEIRKHIGYCPQFDALFDSMTAIEHLWFYARIKGMAEADIPAFVADMVQRLGLSEYADKPSVGYSGGNKRKLSVGVALTGDPQILFLDEPSTGMDPASRRFMWDLISSNMRGRSVILTTHSMEECEALCHRIGIMVGGRLRCLGTANHLKHRFGDGYQLDCNTTTSSTAAAEGFFLRELPGAFTIEKHPHNLKLRIPRAAASLARLFEMTEANKAELQIKEYAISETTLEQIFIHFARQQEEETGNVEGLTGLPDAMGSSRQLGNGNSSRALSSDAGPSIVVEKQPVLPGTLQESELAPLSKSSSQTV